MYISFFLHLPKGNCNFGGGARRCTHTRAATCCLARHRTPDSVYPTTLPSSLLLRRQTNKVYSLTVKTQAVERARTIYTGHTGLPLFTLRYEQARRRQRRGEMGGVARYIL